MGFLVDEIYSSYLAVTASFLSDRYSGHLGPLDMAIQNLDINA